MPPKIALNLVEAIEAHLSVSSAEYRIVILSIKEMKNENKKSSAHSLRRDGNAIYKIIG